MKKIITNLPPILVHISIKLCFLYSTLLGLVNFFLLYFKKIKLRYHLLLGIILSVTLGIYWYSNGICNIIPREKYVIGIYFSIVVIVKIFYRLFEEHRRRIRNKALKYRSIGGLPGYIIMSRKDYYNKGNIMKQTYQLKLDFDQPAKLYDTLKEVFDVLKENGHIFISSKAFNEEKYMKAAEYYGGSSLAYLLYIETSLSEEGVFCDSIEFWIENYMIDEFYYPDKMPYIEVLN